MKSVVIGGLYVNLLSISLILILACRLSAQV